MNKKTFIIAISTLMLDQLFKIIIETSLSLNSSVIIIKNFFSFTSTYNYGAAWSLFNNQVPFLIIFSIVALGLIILKMLPTFKIHLRNIIAFGLLIGGVAGNLLDRLFLGYVRDFIAFKFGSYHFPIFNISDIAIFFGVILLIYAIFKGEDHENQSRNSKPKN